MENSREHTSRFRSHPGTRRTSAPHNDSDALGLPDGDLEPSERPQDNHLLQHQGEEYLDNTQPVKTPKLPWWKTPSSWWWASLRYMEKIFTLWVRARILTILPFTAIAFSSTITPRIEIYTSLACSLLRPHYGESLQQPANILDFLHSNDCRVRAVDHQSSCVDISDVFMIDKSLQINAADTPPPRKQRCASDPVVQAAVAKLSTRAYRSIYSFF